MQPENKKPAQKEPAKESNRIELLMMVLQTMALPLGEDSKR